MFGRVLTSNCWFPTAVGADAQDVSWNAGKKFMGNVDSFLKSLQNFDKDNVPLNCVDKVSALQWVSAGLASGLDVMPSADVRVHQLKVANVQVEKDYISNPGFTPANIKSKSGAAAGLCSWVVNICKYFRIYQVVTEREYLPCALAVG